jgi:hypothetical protein
LAEPQVKTRRVTYVSPEGGHRRHRRERMTILEKTGRVIRALINSKQTRRSRPIVRVRLAAGDGTAFRRPRRLPDDIEEVYLRM